MACVSESHDAGYQHEAGKHPWALNSDKTDFLPRYPVVGQYDKLGRPRVRLANTPLDSTPDNETDRSRDILGSMATLELRIQPEAIHETLLEVSRTPRLPPRRPPSMEPHYSDTTILQPSVALEKTPLFAKSSLSQQRFKMDSSNLMPESLVKGPEQGLTPSNVGPSPKPLDFGFSDRPNNSHVSLDSEWKRIKRLRVATWGLRSKIHELRSVLREKQRERSTADDRFLQHVRMRGFGVTLEDRDILKEQRSMTELLEECQRTRDEYGPLEDDCNLLEDQLGRDEFELTKLEENFNKRQVDPGSFQVVQQDHVSDSEEVSNYSESDVAKESHPLVTKYLSQLGDLDIVKERLDYHIEEKFALEDEKESRQRVGLSLASDDQEWLDSYEGLEMNLLKEIDEAKAEAEKLEKLCFEQGLVDEDGNPTDFENQERHTFMLEAPEVDAGTERSEFVKFPVLLPHPGSKEVLLLNSGPKAVEHVSHSAGDHINQWLLHQLRSSPLDVNLLARTFEASFGHIKGEKWQSDVLAFWYSDGSQTGAAEHLVHSSGKMTQAPRHSPHSGKSLSYTSERFPYRNPIGGSLLQAGSESTSDSGSLKSIESKKPLGPLLPSPFPEPKVSQSIS